MDKLISSLKESGLILALATVFLYCAGSAEYGGYLGTLFLDPDVLNRDFHEILYRGFVVSFDLIIKVFLVYVAGRYAYSYGILPEYNDRKWHRFSAPRKVKKFKKSWFKSSNATWRESPLEIREKQHAHAAAIYGLLFFVFIWSLVHFERHGKETAEALLLNIRLNQTVESNFIDVNINNEKKHLYFLACGARNCAGMEIETMKVYYFPQNGHSYRYVNPVVPTPIQEVQP